MQPSQGSCDNSCTGDYYADEYRIEFRFNYSGWNIRKYMPNTIGTNASPFKVASWCDIYDIVESPTIVNSMAKAVTYVYYVKTLLNGRSIKKWFPCTPEQARIGITYTPAQNANNCPNPCYPLSVNRYTTPMEAK